MEGVLDVGDSMEEEKIAQKARRRSRDGAAAIFAVANAGDQVPPYADEARIRLMRDMAKKYGCF